MPSTPSASTPAAAMPAASTTYDALVIGGGLAGCAAAAHLARRGHTVALLEKGHYPRHRLCGEFLSPETQGLFADLGVLEAVRAAGACTLDRLRATAPSGASYAEALPGPALGLSRYRLDALLFDHACAAGADGHTGAWVRRVEGSLDDGFAVHTRDATFAARLVLGAYGKRGGLDRTLDRPFLRDHAPFVGFKAHYAGLEVPRTIELHAFPGGYAGLSHVEDERLNLCWIMREEVLKEAGGGPEAVIDHALRRNDALAARLDAMTRVTDFCAVSQVSLARKTPFAGDVCMIGDTAGMIAPMCGDGMAMALQSAALAAPLASDLLAGRLAPAAFRRRYADAWQRHFALRLRLGRWLHHRSLKPHAVAAVVRALRWVPPVGRWLIRATRG